MKKKLLTEEGARTLQAVLRGHPREAIIILARVSGARRDELIQMTWKNLDLEKRELQVQNTKTKHGYRVICLPEEVIEVLKQHRRKQREAQAKAGADWQDRDLIFPDDVGEMLKPEQLLKDWKEILEQAALPHIPFHKLRVAVGQELYEQIRATKEQSDDVHDGSLESNKNSDSW